MEVLGVLIMYKASKAFDVNIKKLREQTKLVARFYAEKKNKSISLTDLSHIVVYHENCLLQLLDEWDRRSTDNE